MRHEKEYLAKRERSHFQHIPIILLLLLLPFFLPFTEDTSPRAHVSFHDDGNIPVKRESFAQRTKRILLIGHLTRTLLFINVRGVQHAVYTRYIIENYIAYL